MTRTVLHGLTALSLSTIIASTSIPAAAAVVAAPTLCIPDITGTGPQWWTGAGNGAANWSHGAGMSVASGAVTSDARLLWDPNKDRILVRVRAQGIAAIDPTEDVFAFAVSDATGLMPELYIQFRPLSGCSKLADCEGDGAAISTSAIRYSAASSVTSLTWSPLSANNPDPAFKVQKPWISVVVDDSGPVDTYDWTLTFALKVPVDGSGDIRPDLRAYGNVIDHVNGPTSDSKVELPVLCRSSSLTSNDCLVETGSGLAQLPADLPLGNMVASWPRLRSDC